MTPSLFIATPAYRSQVSARFTESLLWTSNVLRESNIRHVWKYVDAPVNIARNILVAKFLAGNYYSHMLFIDEDLGWKPDAVLRLMGATTKYPDVMVATGVYRKRCEKLEWPVNFAARPSDDGFEYPVVHPESGYIQLIDATTGFMMLTRGAIDEMVAMYPERKCNLRGNPHPQPAEQPFERDLFPFTIDPVSNMLLTEDFGFCRLWQNIGGRVWADPEIELDHAGFKGSIKTLFEDANVG